MPIVNDYNDNEKNIDLDATKQIGEDCIANEQCTAEAVNSECDSDLNMCQCTTHYQGYSCDECMYLYSSDYTVLQNEGHEMYTRPDLSIIVTFD